MSFIAYQIQKLVPQRIMGKIHQGQTSPGLRLLRNRLSKQSTFLLFVLIPALGALFVHFAVMGLLNEQGPFSKESGKQPLAFLQWVIIATID